VPQVSPTVSKEAWERYAINKMTQGYVIIIRDGRRSANFYKPGKGFEACSFKTAQKLLAEGCIVNAGRHELGTVYRLAPTAELIMPPPRIATIKDDDDDAVAIDDTDIETQLDDLTEDIEDDEIEEGEDDGG